MARLLSDTQVGVLADRGYRGMGTRSGAVMALPIGKWKEQGNLPRETRTLNYLQASLRSAVERTVAHLGNASAMRRWRGRIARIRDVIRAATVVICLNRWVHRIPA